LLLDSRVAKIRAKGRGLRARTPHATDVAEGRARWSGWGQDDDDWGD